MPEHLVRELLDVARWAPNHKLTNPWRFRLLGPETRARIEALAGEKEAAKLRRAPTLVLATAVLSDDPVLAEEDLLATGAAVYAVLLAATGRGLASYWRTPAAAFSTIAPGEHLVALIHLGPPQSDPPVKGRAALDEVYASLP